MPEKDLEFGQMGGINAPSPKKIFYLEGLRGVAALLVAFSHVQPQVNCSTFPTNHRHSMQNSITTTKIEFGNCFTTDTSVTKY